MSGTSNTPPNARTLPSDGWKTSWTLLAAIFAVSRLIYFAAWVRIDTRPLEKFFQIYDPLLLKTQLWETLFYAHTQPPGFNLLIGLVLKAFPENYGPAFHFLFLLCGLIVTLCLYELMRVLGVRRPVAIAVTALFAISPGVVLFENLLIYETLLLALLCASAVCFYQCLRKPSRAVLSLFFFLMLALVSVRSLFHLAYMALAVAVMAMLLRGQRRMVLTAAAIPFALAFGIYAKNLVLYGSFSSSTWMGFNAYTITVHQLNPQEKDRFVAQGAISPLELLEPLGHLQDYPDYARPVAPTGIPVLDQTADSTGRANFNNPGYFQLQKIYLRDAAYLMRHYPKAYVRSLVKAWFAYFLPTSDFPFFTQNRPLIRTWDRLFNLAVFGQLREASNRKDLRRMEAGGASVLSIALYTGTFLMVGLPLLFVFGVTALVKGLRSRTLPAPTAALLGFLLFHVLMITMMVNLLSSFENNRYRLPIDGFFAVLFAMAVEKGIQWLRQPRQASAPNSPSVSIAAAG